MYIKDHSLNKVVSLSFFIILSVLLISCKDKSVLKDVGKNGNVSIENNYNVVFSGIPDTLFSGEIFNGKIKYKSALDTINLSDKDERLTLLYLSSDDLPKVEMKRIKEGEHNIFTAKKTGYIEFKYKIVGRGVRYLTGVIEDEVYLTEYENGKIRIITNNIKISKEIYIK